MSVRTFRRIAAAALAAVVLAGTSLPGAPASAREPEQTAPVMLVLDASGSMAADAPGGGNKMAAARTAIGALAGQAPQGARLGLTVYGAGTGNAPADKARGCQDVRVVQPVGTDPRAIARAAQGVRPSGYTPIGKALEAAAAALPREGPRSIVLVSDGEDTCAPPQPCEVAKRLAEQGVDLRVHTVGFDVDGATRRQLTCIAQAAGGTYTDAPEAGDLGSALNRVTQRALRSYEPAGTPVTGGGDAAGAPALQPGAYLDQIGPGQTLYYAVDVPADHRLYVTGTIAYVDEGGLRLEGRVETPGGTVCERLRAHDPSGPTSVPVASTSFLPGDRNRCSKPGRHIVTLHWDRSRTDGTADAAALEILIGLEPPLAGDPGPPAGAPVAFAAPGGTPVRAVGGGSFGAAATLPGSGSYTDTVRHGEVVFFRVKLDWGQGLAYRLRLPVGARHDRDGTMLVISDLWSTSRQREFTSSFRVLYKGETLTQFQPSGDDRSAFAIPPVRYLNRKEYRTGHYSVAGWHYISVGFDGLYGSPDLSPLDVTLEVSVVGDPEPGPRYAGTGPAFGSPGGPAAAPGGGAETPGPMSRTAGRSPLIWAGVPLLVLAAAGGVTLLAVLFRRRRA